MDLGLHQPWVGPPGASTCNEHAAFSSGCGPYLVRMIHGKKARPIQKDGTLQRVTVLVGGLGPAPTAGHPWVGPPGASTCNEHAAFSSGCGPYLVRMIHGILKRPGRYKRTGPYSACWWVTVDLGLHQPWYKGRM